MLEYHEEIERRICQFTGYLKKMHSRSHQEVEGSCFIIFDEQPPNDGSVDRKLAESVKPALELVVTGFDEAGIGGDSLADTSCLIDLPDDGWKQDDSQPRFIQFAFKQHWFCLDMPIQTLYRPEAEQICRSRTGFFYVRDRPQFALKDDDFAKYDPFRKIYVYGDERTAAEDMAFIFFQVWRFPVDWRFYVKAAAFGDKKTNWEKGTPIE